MTKRIIIAACALAFTILAMWPHHERLDEGRVVTTRCTEGAIARREHGGGNVYCNAAGEWEGGKGVVGEVVPIDIDKEANRP